MQEQGASEKNQNAGTPLAEELIQHLALLTTVAEPPAFNHPDIQRRYELGIYNSRLEAELDDVLCGPRLVPIALGNVAQLMSLHGIVYIKDGEALPLLNLEQFLADLPKSLLEMNPLQRLKAAHSLGRILHIYAGIILDGLAEEQDQTQPSSENQQDQDDDPGELCGILV